MTQRQHKKRTTARVVHRARILARFTWADEMGEDHYFHDDDGEVHDRTCTHCDGSGRDKWNDGLLPCEHCDGEGYEWWK